MTRLIDISPPVSPRLAVWPGDVPFERAVSHRIGPDAVVELSSIRATVHLGAHADAPSHYRAGAPTIDARPLERYYGPCQVIGVRVAPGARVEPADLAAPVLAPRVLLRTGSWPDPEQWRDDFAALSPALVHWLADAGVVLVGIDTPSVDPFDSERLESHQALADRDLAVLECLRLEGVSDGAYTLVALPLKLEGADASPVRAALIPAEPATGGE